MIPSRSFRHLSVGLAVDVVKGIGTGDAVIATEPPRLQLFLRWVKMLQWWLCSVWKGSCCLQIVILFLPVTSLVLYLPLVWEVPRSLLEKAIFLRREVAALVSPEEQIG